jgi:N6-adenosine-specific RNA methylase IME4
VLRAWGFEPKTMGFTWVKYHEGSEKRCVGGGYWTRSNPEFCVLAVRGEPPRRVDARVRQLVETGGEDVLLAPRGEHSAKPDEVRDRIVQLLPPGLSRLEMFARTRAEGWDAHGDQVPGGADLIF